MEIITVESLMVPIEEYATVTEDATLYEAVKALEKAQEELYRTGYLYLHRAVLVLDKNKKVVGKISQLDVLSALEPKYAEMGDMRAVSRAGFSPDFLKSIMERFALCERPIKQMCKSAASRQVTEFMYTPTEAEYVEAETSLCEAIHRFVMGHHQSLLVVRNEEIVGVLRLTDVFKEVFQTMESHRIE